MDKNKILKLIKIANQKYPPIILIEGVSGVGKSHLIKEIQKTFPEKIIKVEHNPSSSPLAMKLIEWAKYNKLYLTPFALTCFYLIGQYEIMENLEKLDYLSNEIDLIILDRSVFISGFIYQGYNGGQGFVSCEKSLELLAETMKYFFKITAIFLLTGDTALIAERRRNAQNKKYKYIKDNFCDEESIFLEQECYIDFAKRIHNLNKNFPEPCFFDVSKENEKNNLLKNIKNIMLCRKEILDKYY